MNSLHLPPPTPDCTRWQAIKQGDQAAFEQLYTATSHSLIRYGYTLTTDSVVIQNAIQNLFADLWENRRRLTVTGPAMVYLLSLLRPKLLPHQQRISAGLADEWSLPTGPDETDDTVLLAQATRTHAARLATALGQLPNRQREAIHLSYVQKLGHEQVADVMGVNSQSAGNFVYTALKTLRQQLRLSSLFPVLIGLATQW